ncbi:MAG: methyltransferase [Spirochaetia bacterium]|nr:methyltransferase [Spirochaetia bacterium]
MGKKHSHSKTYYNDIALKLAHRVLGIEHLHYGYFLPGQKAVLENLPRAQAQYVKNLLSFIPKKGIKHIFDVGCGTGGVATELLKKKMQLTCLAPDPYLITKTKENTKNRVETITDLYENVEGPSGLYDMILMSESCQYVKIKEGWEQHSKFLRPGGYVLIADFFRIRELDQPYLSKSGHPLKEFIETAENLGFSLIKKQDITKFVAPTMTIYQNLITGKIFPVIEAIFEFTARKFPRFYKIMRKFLKNKVLFLKTKYENQGPDIFKKYKSYQVLLFQKKS